jgi:crossover junction endodeoxyribonuclease RuvC
MRVLGIDPGIASTGYGCVDQDSRHQYKLVDCGVIKTPAHTDIGARLFTIHRELTRLVKQLQPDMLVVEQLIFNSNQKTAILVGQARGVILMTGAKARINCYEFTPIQVKLAVTGYGRAEKKQVQEMVRRILNLDQIPKPDDAADGLALALCY